MLIARLALWPSMQVKYSKYLDLNCCCFQKLGWKFDYIWADTDDANDGVTTITVMTIIKTGDRGGDGGSSGDHKWPLI